MTGIEEKLLQQFDLYAANRPAPARLASYREWIADRRAEGGYSDDDLAWADVQCQVASKALDQGDIDGLLEAFDRMRNALIDAGAPKLVNHAYQVNRSKGGKTTAAKLKDQPLPAWMIELFNRAYVEIERDGKARVGHVALLGAAWREAGPGHPHRDELTEHRARQYLKTRPKLPR